MSSPFSSRSPSPLSTDDKNEKHIFGTSILQKRPPISFIRARNTSSPPPPTTAAPVQKSAAQQYLDIVSGTLSASKSIDKHNTESITESAPERAESAETVGNAEKTESTQKEQLDLCTVCGLPVTLSSTPSLALSSAQSTHLPHPAHSHETLLAHQISLPHIHAPSALDRTRMGLRYLVSHGWDPDSREGLGKTGDGRRIPVKAVVKRDTLGLGVEKPVAKKIKKKKMLGAKEVRIQAAEDRKKGDALRGRMFGREEEVERLMNGG